MPPSTASSSPPQMKSSRSPCAATPKSSSPSPRRLAEVALQHAASRLVSTLRPSASASQHFSISAFCWALTRSPIYEAASGQELCRAPQSNEPRYLAEKLTSRLAKPKRAESLRSRRPEGGGVLKC